MKHIFQYNNQDVTFQLGNGDVMVNATQMAKPFGKTTKDYLKTQSTNELIKALSVRRNVLTDDLVRVTQGGVNQGTWLHEDIALDFAQWLSIDFKLWCNDRIKELLQKGFTATPDKLEELIQNPDLLITLATQLKNERAEKERLLIENNRMKPRDEYIDKVFCSDGLLTMSEASKSLGLDIGRNILYNILRDKGILFKGSKEPKQEFVNRGYFAMKQTMIQIKKGDATITKVEPQTMVTQKGLGYIAKILGIVNITNT